MLSKVLKLFPLYLVILFFLGFKEEMIISLVYILAHEFTHYIVARILGFSAYGVKLLPFGAVLNLKELDEAEPFEDFLLSISGPGLNIILSFIFYFLYYKYGMLYFYKSSMCNWILGIFNLIPAFPLDGGRILRDFLSLKTLYKKANKITLNVGIVIGSILCFFYFICFFRGYVKLSWSLGCIALFITITSMKEKERMSYIIMGDIIKKKNRFINRGYIENRNVSIYYKDYLLQALELIDKNKYNVFLVLDENMTLMDIIYEDEILDALKTYGNITLEEFIESSRF